MTRPLDLDAVIDAFTKIMGESPPHGGKTTPDDVDAWDSLTHVHLVHHLEARAAVTIPEDFMLPVPGLTLEALAGAVGAVGRPVP